MGFYKSGSTSSTISDGFSSPGTDAIQYTGIALASAALVAPHSPLNTQVAALRTGG